MASPVSASGTVYDDLVDNLLPNATIMTPAIGISNMYFLKNQIFPITINGKVFDKDNHTHLIDDVSVMLEQEMFGKGVYVNILLPKILTADSAPPTYNPPTYNPPTYVNLLPEILTAESAPPYTPIKCRMSAYTNSPPFAPIKHRFIDHDKETSDVKSVSSDSSTSDTMPGLESVCQLTNEYELIEDSDDMDSVYSDSSRDSMPSLESISSDPSTNAPLPELRNQNWVDMVINFNNTMVTTVKSMSSNTLTELLLLSPIIVPLSVEDRFGELKPMDPYHQIILNRCIQCQWVHKLTDYKFLSICPRIHEMSLCQQLVSSHE